MIPPRDALAELQARGRFGIRLGLARTRALLRRMGDPHLELRGALIGGTNGKGSTQALVAQVLRAQGLRVGQTPKPHLVSYRERIVVDGRAIDGVDLATLLAEVLDSAAREERRHGPATEFELLTVAAFTWFRRQGVEVAVVEVGLGGRLDATNAWDGGVAAITSVGLDHVEHLGPTVEAIAREKAAIIKRGDRAVTAASGTALSVVRSRARRLGVPLTVVEPLPLLDLDLTGIRVAHPELGELHIGLAGRHQAANAALSLGILDALEASGIARVGEAALRRGLAEARWPGRLELVESAGVQVLLDGAHNADGATALACACDDLRHALPPGRLTLLLAILRDKEVAAMLERLVASAALRDAQVIATDVPGSPRSLPAADLAAAWETARAARPGSRPAAVAIPETAEALAAALQLCREEGGPLIVAGSLYLVGDVRGRLMGRELDD